MRFGALKRNWEGLGRRDPLWAVLTDPDKQCGGWDVHQFFQTGVDEIVAVMRRADVLGLEVRRGRALDFGCGVGRLTQALGDHFERCDGVDISESMLTEARRHDRHGGRCTYYLNARPDLALFPDGVFDFVYTVIVLQHMEPRHSTVYIRELIRVLAPGGLLVFQVPSEPLRVVAGGESEVLMPAGATPALAPLSVEACRARIAVCQRGPLRTQASGHIRLDLTVENLSATRWPALPAGSGRYGINVANHWVDAQGRVVERDDARQALPHDVPPGATAEVTLLVTAPDVDGECWIEVDLVQEDVSWFAARGSAPAHVACRVEGGATQLPPLVGDAPPSVPAKTEPEEPGVPFRFRHPRVFAVLRATRLRDGYWAWRRGVDAVKTKRDDLIRLGKTRLVNWRKRRRVGPHMEMHCVPRAQVAAIVEACGARLADAEEERTPHFLSYRYWVVK